MRARCLAAAPVSSAAICTATACAAPAVAKDGESTGALCHKHNLCSFLPVCPSLLVAGVLRLTLQVLRLIPTASQVAAMFLIPTFNLQTHSPPAIQQFIFTSPSVDACEQLSSSPNEATASQVLQAPSLSLAVSVRPAYTFSNSASLSLPLPSPPTSLSLPSFLFPLLPLTLSLSAHCVSALIRGGQYTLYEYSLCPHCGCCHVFPLGYKYNIFTLI